MVKPTSRARPVASFTDNRTAVIEHDRIMASVLSVDEAARAAERRWGVGRLLRLVSPATLVRFRQAHVLWTRTPTDATTLDAMRRQAWHEHGAATLAIADITDPWLRQAINNEAARRWGPRQGAQHHGQ